MRKSHEHVACCDVTFLPSCCEATSPPKKFARKEPCFNDYIKIVKSVSIYTNHGSASIVTPALSDIRLNSESLIGHYTLAARSGNDVKFQRTVNLALNGTFQVKQRQNRTCCRKMRADLCKTLLSIDCY